MRPLLLVLAFVCAISTLSGCGGASPTAPVAVTKLSADWLGIPSAVNFVIHALHDGTGWLLNKSQVQIATVGAVRADEKEGYLTDFRIHVANGLHSFETTAKDVPCDKDGVPTEAAVTKLRQAVEDIKAKIKRLQN